MLGAFVPVILFTLDNSSVNHIRSSLYIFLQCICDELSLTIYWCCIRTRSAGGFMHVGFHHAVQTVFTVISNDNFFCL